MGFGTPSRVTDEVLFDDAITREHGFIATSGVVSLAASGGTETLTIENPSGSGVTLVVVGNTVSITGQAEVHVFDDFTSDPSGGSAVGIDNLLLDAGGGVDQGNANARTGDSFTAGNPQDTRVIGGGSGGQAVGGSSSVGEFYIEPGRAVVTQLTNTTSESEDATISTTYFERQKVFVGP